MWDTSLTPIPIGGTPNYAKLTASRHPRMLFTQADFDGVKDAVAAGTNPALTEIHNELIYNADRCEILGRYMGHCIR